jgi:hypothetical protein
MPDAEKFMSWWKNDNMLPDSIGKYRAIVCIIKDGKIKSFIFNVIRFENQVSCL